MKNRQNKLVEALSSLVSRFQNQIAIALVFWLVQGPSCFADSSSTPCFDLQSRSIAHESVEHNEPLATAKLVLARQEHLMDELFATSGFESFEEFRSVLHHQTDPTIKKIAQIFEHEQVEVGINAHEETRLKIMESGFLNQHQVGTSSSKGVYKGAVGRNAIEASFLGISGETYSEFNNNVKPVYGQINPKPETGFVPLRTGNYGPDLYTLKMSAIRERLSITPGDSLLRLKTIFGTAWQNGKVRRPTTWDQIFIPWRFRELLSTFVAGYLKKDAPTDIFACAEPEKLSTSAKDLKLGLPRVDGLYIEAQVFGGVNLADVESFTFMETPPTGVFLAELRKRNIKIFHAPTYTGPAVEWFEPVGN